MTFKQILRELPYECKLNVMYNKRDIDITKQATVYIPLNSQFVDITFFWELLLRWSISFCEIEPIDILYVRSCSALFLVSIL